MSNLSIWHLLAVLIPVLIFYGIYRIGKALRPNISKGAGVGGWLLLLVLGMLLIGPFFGAARINADVLQTEIQNPALTNIAAWQNFKTALWLAFCVIACLSIYAGYGLLTGKDRSVVNRAIIMQWICGPLGSIALGVIVPMATIGNGAVDSGFIKATIVSSIGAAIWTAYLKRSKRVKATYG